VNNEERVAAVELKSHNPNTGGVSEQLQNAAALMEGLLDGYPDTIRFAAAVLVNGISSAGIRAFAKRRVSFRSRVYPIQVKSCGCALERLYSVS
jgi:hypothetical protein